MGSSFEGNQNNFLPQTYIIPEDDEQKDIMLRQYLNNIATATNTKDSGFYNATETITGQQFLPLYKTDTSTNANPRNVFRKVIDFGVLPNTATKSVAHGIVIGADFSVTKLYGGSTNPSTTWIPLPYASPTAANNIELFLNATNVVITTGSNRTNFTRTYVVVEYIKVV